ncbi:PadR family transcriptional regulator [Halomarina ordinaria]|uniref:PadR family transcriptional regulator n=1 Tax=Halomarina ordinaria TaxID=3033939 RepID=A0ABD5UBP6_9EURY|nr:helix-turn-helix transcriptional regulator [Halomarina sp. PSRA2]
MVGTTARDDDSDGPRTGITVEALYNELHESVETADDAADDPDARVERVVRGALDDRFSDDEFGFDEELVKANLDELLLVLVGVRESKTHGKALIGDLTDHFGAQLSPGTVYPRLHGLADAGFLDAQEMVRTKEYRLADTVDGAHRVERAMRQHLALAAVFYAALEEF